MLIGATLAAITCLWVSNPACAAEYNRLETEHFSLFYLPSDRSNANRLMRVAESVRTQVIIDLGVELDSKTKVYLANSKEEFHRLQPKKAKAPKWAGAVAYSALNLIIIDTSRQNKAFHRDVVNSFKHEFTHIVIGRAFKRGKTPRWLNEGLAMYESREWDVNRVLNMTRAVLTHSLIPLEDLTEHFPWEYQQAALAYDQSFYLVSYLLSKKGTKVFHRFISEYGRGKQLEEVLEDIYGLNMWELEKEWKTHLMYRFSWLSVVFSTTTIWFVITLTFLISYWRKRKQSRVKQTEWEKEEEDILNGEF